VAFPKHVLDMLLKQDSLGDLIALYMFYLYTSAWQGTNRPKATTRYAARGLRRTEKRVRRAKKELLAIALLRDVALKDEHGRVKGWVVELPRRVLPRRPRSISTGWIDHSMEADTPNAYHGEFFT